MSAKTIKLTSYDILYNSDWKTLETYLEQSAYSKIAVLVDENTREYCLPIFQQQLAAIPFFAIEIVSGEKHKTLDTCRSVWEQLLLGRADRKSLLINLGGGVIGDLGGFCASTYMRGIDFIQVPTTLLSQVDASIGGKLGIDFGGGKNLVGVFKDPKMVFIDTKFLGTLPEREYKSGFAEIIKHALIRDPEMWDIILGTPKIAEVPLNIALLRSLQIKKEVVESDPFEKGWRKILNWGHTIGHALESCFLYSSTPLLHGEAIAFGMVCEAFLSFKLAGFPHSELESISSFILKHYGRITIESNQYDELIELMKKDKKNEGGSILFTLLESVGQPLINQACPVDLIKESLVYLNKQGGATITPP